MATAFTAPGLPLNATLAMMQATPSGAAPAAKSTLDPKKLAEIDNASKEFEGMFMSEMIKPMFEGIKTDGMFGGGKGEEVFRGMMVQEYGKILSQAGGVGMASSIKDQMIKIQEQVNNGAQSKF